MSCFRTLPATAAGPLARTCACPGYGPLVAPQARQALQHGRDATDSAMGSRCRALSDSRRRQRAPGGRTTRVLQLGAEMVRSFVAQGMGPEEICTPIPGGAGSAGRRRVGYTENPHAAASTTNANSRTVCRTRNIHGTHRSISVTARYERPVPWSAMRHSQV